MKVIMIMFDSLNRRMLKPYGCEWVKTPNFYRLGKKSIIFQNAYAGSMACMPARRELHTGRYNFLHRSWGPIEPFDDSMPEILKSNGVTTHLISDHYHYWEDGGATYHSRYSSWESSRGQEGDPWKEEIKGPDCPEPNPLLNYSRRQDWVNRSYMANEKDFPQAKTFAMGKEFLAKNHNADNWFLQIETFDPHEPYFAPNRFREMYPHKYEKIYADDWPPYGELENSNYIRHLKNESAALHSMCDCYLGKILDLMDRYDLWKDTMLIVNTDHGFLLGEHGWSGKCVMPFYNEIVNIPLFIWNPRYNLKGESRNSLVQTIDIPATILDFFNVPQPSTMFGCSLADVIKSDSKIRKAGLFGVFGGSVCITDGRYVYMRAPKHHENEPLYEYTLMPTQHGSGRGFCDLERLALASFSPPFCFTKKCPLIKIPGRKQFDHYKFGNLLFDLHEDPFQETPIMNIELEKHMIKLMVELMHRNDTPMEQYQRLSI